MSDGQINLFAGNFRHVEITDSRSDFGGSSVSLFR